FWIGPLLQRTPYDAVRDFAPITLTDRSPLILTTHPSVAAKSVQELIALARAKPGALNFAENAIGGPSHLAAELFKSMAGVSIVHVPYKGTAPATIALLAGEVQLFFAAPVVVPGHVKAGKMIALAVTSAEPSVLVPGLPTVAAAIPGYEIGASTGI